VRSDCSTAGAPEVAGIKILLIASGWYPERAGGAERTFYDHVRELPCLGASVHGIAPSARADSDPAGLVSVLPVTDRRLPARLWLIRRAVGRALKSCQPDVVGAHFALYGLPVLDKIGSRPLVVHFHGPWGAESRAEGAGRVAVAAKVAIERLVYGRARLLIVLSQAFAQILERNYRVPLERIRVVPGAVDCERFATKLTQREAREAMGWPADRPTILAVRRLVRRVGISTLFAAMAEVRRIVPEARLVIAGRGPEATSLRAEIERRGLCDVVDLIGFVSDELLPIAYRAADITVMPSAALEGFGLAAIESLAAGTPALVTPVGGLPETVEGLSTGLIMPGSSPDDLADSISAAVKGVLALPSEAACRAFAKRYFDRAIIVRKLCDAYVEALG
jgi:glycogen(starch) synthase